MDKERFPNKKSVEEQKANLTDANLTGANLDGANLTGADLAGVDLSGSDLKYAGLIAANLKGATFTGSKLISANLSGANLSGADFSPTDESGDTYMFDTIISHADLAIKCALEKTSGVVGIDENDNELKCIEFNRIKGGKPFDYKQVWYADLLKKIS